MNVVSELFRPRPEPRVIAWLEALTDDVAITALTLGELRAGVRRDRPHPAAARPVT